jgi:filamentous hemagglutinin family protein
MTAVAALLIAQRPAFSGPTGGTVVDGSAGISQSGSVTNINQSTNKAIINWQGFSIGANETVNFNQPGSSSVTLNRVIGNETSVISGALNANGQVFIVNSAGVLFGKNAQVNVGGLVASTLDISNANFMAGNYVFSGNSQASIVNQGRIRAHDGGYVALLGKTVSNDGVISARLGTVAMAAGNQITLNFGGDSLLDVTIDQGTLNALVENKRAIIANGGQVIMTAKAADAVLSAQVNNSGIIQARTMAALTGGSGKTRPAKTGSIKLIADGGTTNVSGKLDASAPKGGDGGFIETSGNAVNIAKGTKVTTLAANGKTGNWLIDPNDFTIAASGGNMTAADVVSNLATTNFEISTAAVGTPGGNGDINVNQALNWNTAQTLTLTAERNININSAITASSGGLTLNAANQISATAAVSVGTFTLAGGNWNQIGAVLPGFSAHDFRISGGSFLRVAGGNGSSANPYQIVDIYGLQGIGSASNLGKSFVLANDITNAAVTASWNSGAGFIPIGNSSTMFSGVFDGNNHTIIGLTINNTSSTVDIGLFGAAGSTSAIRNVTLASVNIRGGGGNGTDSTGNGIGVGALVGLNFAEIDNAHVSGTVSGVNGNVGGLIGFNGKSTSATVNTISDSTSSATVSGGSGVGGLIGTDFNGDVYRSSATGNVTARSTGGGLIGGATNVNVSDSYATGAVTGNSGANGLGGLIGTAAANASALTINNSYATGDVTGGDGLGGLVGLVSANLANFTIENSHALGNVKSVNASALTPVGVGGLVGSTSTNPGKTVIIENSYAQGAVGFFAADGVHPGAVGNGAGGLVGNMSGGGLIDNSHATGDVTGSLTGSKVGGLVGADTATNISNSYATGNVSGNLTVGGLVGGSSGTIGNSYATGNVTGYNTPGSNNIGGLVGTNTGAGVIINSHADGNVNGQGPNASTGGLVGSNAGSIADSYATGTVKGPSGLTGGIAGSSFNNSGDPNNTTAGSITNSWYNSEKNPGLPITNSLACCNPGLVTGGGGLTTAQFADIPFYLNGTINQVLADRAAAAAAQAAAAARAAAQFAQAASRTANTVASNAAASASTAPDSTLSASGTQATGSSTSAKIDGNLKSIEDSAKAGDQRERRRVVTATTARSSHPRAHGGAGLGATIRSIDVDGQRFDLRGDGKKDAPGQKP